ncbi:MAG: hypothetical protein ABIW34_15070 [Ginsengibacter sp.]
MCKSHCQGKCSLDSREKCIDLKALPDLDNISKRDQCVHESKTWERSLDFFKQENTFLKNRLSAVVDDKDDNAFLLLAEYFQNQFVLKDEFIKDLKRDVTEQEKNITANFTTQCIDNKILKRQEKLRNEIDFFEKDFAFLKQEFNKAITRSL